MIMAVQPIRYRNRETGKIETEKVYGEAFLQWAYGSAHGRLALHAFVKRPFFSQWYAVRMNAPKTTDRIVPFLQNYGLDSAEFVKAPDEFTSFNDFFYRKLKPGARPVSDSPVVLPADGRHLGFPKASAIESVFVKGQRFNLPALLGSPDLAERYRDGPLILSRLCPVDYHRFHFPCAGIPGETRLLNGPLFSVSPIALRRNLSYLWQNKRTLTELETRDFGIVLCMEIGATCVGSIHQTFIPGQPVEKGAEKGYFAFGGSSTLLLFEPGTVTLSQDLVTAGHEAIELYAKVGSAAGN